MYLNGQDQLTFEDRVGYALFDGRNNVIHLLRVNGLEPFVIPRPRADLRRRAEQRGRAVALQRRPDVGVVAGARAVGTGVAGHWTRRRCHPASVIHTLTSTNPSPAPPSPLRAPHSPIRCQRACARIVVLPPLSLLARHVGPLSHAGPLGSVAPPATPNLPFWTRTLLRWFSCPPTRNTLWTL